MVRIGFVRSLDGLPADCPRVVFHEKVRGACELSHMLRSWEEKGRQYGALDIGVPPLMGVEAWVPVLSVILSDLAWPRWALDTETMARVQGMSFRACLNFFGRYFWSGYQKNSVAYILVGNLRTTLEHVVRQWEARFDHVRIDPEEDLEGEQTRQVVLQHERFGRKALWRRLWPVNDKIRGKGNP